MSAPATLPPGYVKVPCEPCKGTGRVPRSQGFYTINSNRRRKPQCPKCSGFGFHVIGDKSK